MQDSAPLSRLNIEIYFLSEQFLKPNKINILNALLERGLFLSIFSVPVEPFILEVADQLVLNSNELISDLILSKIALHGALPQIILLADRAY